MNDIMFFSSAGKCYRSTGLHPDRFNKWKHTLFPITFDPWRDIGKRQLPSVSCVVGSVPHGRPTELFFIPSSAPQLV